MRVPSNKAECKNGGWRELSDGSAPFKNQGDCVQLSWRPAPQPARAADQT